MTAQIAVVGGGFAGMAAAFELSNRDLNVTVLEARQRVGGRVWSTRLPNGTIVELGGEWISSGDHTIIELAKRFNLPLVHLGVDFRIREVISGSAVSPADQREVHRIAINTLAGMNEAAVADSTIDEFLETLPLTKPEASLLRSRLQNSYGSDLGDIALRMLGEYSLGEGGSYYRFAAGNQILAERMATDLPDVRLGHAATVVTQHQHGVAIKGKSENGAFEVEAEAVILAIPVKCLADLVFNPTLPPVVSEAISSVPMGIGAKVAIGTQNPPPLRAFHDVEVPYWCWTGNGQGGVPRCAVTAFCGSSQAQQNLATDGNDPSIWLNKLQSANPDLVFIDDPIMVDWSQDEWSRGCYSAFDNRATDLIPHLSEPVGRIFFAGEHTAEESGTMEGAITSGLRAAVQVDEVFR
jgi:monoamine oxidase